MEPHRDTLSSDTNKEFIIELVKAHMPFGKYKDRLFCDLPERYLVSMHQKGFPRGKIGDQLSAMYEIKINGLEYLLKPFIVKP